MAGPRPRERERERERVRLRACVDGGGAAQVDAFDAGNVSYYPYKWTKGTEANASTFYGLFVHVPSSMLVLELMSNASLKLANATILEPRMSPKTLDYAASDAYEADYLANETLKVVSVSRATADVDAIAAFYDAINVSTTYAYDSPEVRKRCFQWWSADVAVCYAERSEITSFFTVADFEAMLNDVHADVLSGNPNCQLDKWTDLHYAYDSDVEDGTRRGADRTPRGRIRITTGAPPRPQRQRRGYLLVETTQFTLP